MKKMAMDDLRPNLAKQSEETDGAANAPRRHVEGRGGHAGRLKLRNQFSAWQQRNYLDGPSSAPQLHG
jgi:hypothetical protein